MSQHPQLVAPMSEPPPYSPRIHYPVPDPDLPPVQLRALQRPPPAHLPQQLLVPRNDRETTRDEEPNTHRSESRAYPPSYIPSHGKDDPESIDFDFAPQPPMRARPSYCCTRRCCVFAFFIIIIAVGVPVGYIMAKKAQFDEQQAAKLKLGT